MSFEPITLNFDYDPVNPGRTKEGVVRLGMIRQGTDQDFEIGFQIDNVDFDFSGYDEAILTARDTVQDDAVVFELKMSDGDIELETGLVTLHFSKEKTQDIEIPKKIPKQPAPQTVSYGFDIHLIDNGNARHAFAAGTLVMVYAFTRPGA